MTGTPVLDFDAPAVIDGEYRYSLTRTWDPSLPPMVFVMLNPSTADGEHDDATIVRCRKRALGRVSVGRLIVVNLFAFRATDPGRLYGHHPDPVGPHNDAWIRAAVTIPGAVVVAAWGGEKIAAARSWQVAAIAAAAGVELHCLGRNRDKIASPKHPLYCRSDAPLLPYEVSK